MHDDFNSIHDDLMDDDTDGSIDPNVVIEEGFSQEDPDLEDEEDYSAELTFDPEAVISTEDDDDDDAPVNTEDEHPIEESQLINDLLKSKGIEDPSVIKYEDESGEIVEVSFYDLSYEEQLNILQSTDSDIDFGLDTHEVDVVNFLRENDVSFDQAIEYYKRQAVEEYIKEQTNDEFTIDSYNDEELFVLDLKSKFDNLTDEELQLELEKETGHPELFKKKVDRIREEYKNLEVQEKEAAEQAKLDREQEKFDVLKDNLVNVATNVEDIGGIVIDNDEKEEILSFVLNKDVNGVSPLLKTMEDPKMLFEMAWYATKGKQAFDFVHDYYKKQIETVRKTAYDKGKLEASKGAPLEGVKKTAVKSSLPAAKGKSNGQSIYDLHD